jgi:hypothetical protein
MVVTRAGNQGPTGPPQVPPMVLLPPLPMDEDPPLEEMNEGGVTPPETPPPTPPRVPRLPPALPPGLMPAVPYGLPPPAWQFAPPVAAGGGGGGNGGGGNGGGGGRPVPTHPGGLDEGATYFTYESRKERKYFEKSTEGLDIKYDGSAKGLQMFITDVEQKSDMFGFLKILSIPTAAGMLSLLDNYGQITISDIHLHAVSYMHLQTRDHQDSNHLKLFLRASLDKTFMMRVLAHKSQYVIGGVQHGPSMFRVILSLVGIQSKATVAVINAALRRLPTKMEGYGSNIEQFNEYVVNQCTELTSRGKTPQDLVS